MAATWYDLLAAAIGGGVTSTIIEQLYLFYVRQSDAKRTAKEIIDKHLESILKSTDDLVGKILSLAKRDFQELIDIKSADDNFISQQPLLTLMYLFAQFWSRIQILKIESQFVNLRSDDRGKKLFEFIKTLDGKRTSIIERSWQRGIGESLICRDSDKLRQLTFYEFVESYLGSNNLQKWYIPLKDILEDLPDKSKRQRVLVYGVVLHALIDTLDEKHLITKERPSWPNKLSFKSRRDLRERVFKIYLKFVKNPERYFVVPHKKM